MSGGDRVTCRFLFRKCFSYKPQFKIWMATNPEPVIRGTDNGTWRRLQLIPFQAKFEAGSKDMHLAEKLRAEASGILNWAIAGLEAYQTDGLRLPCVVEAATKEYRAEQDTVGRFLTTR